MIIANNGNVKVNGTRATLYAELTSILRAFFEQFDMTDEDLNLIIDLSKMSSEELDAEMKKEVMNVMSIMIDKLGTDVVGEVFRKAFYEEDK